MQGKVKEMESGSGKGLEQGTRERESGPKEKSAIITNE